VHSIHYASRTGPDGGQSNQAIVTLLQTANLDATRDGKDVTFTPNTKDANFYLVGGCTIIFDLDTLTLKHIISKPLLDVNTLASGKRQINLARAMQTFNHSHGITSEVNPYRAYFATSGRYGLGEPFSFLHTH
jgi:hypothetical protein